MKLKDFLENLKITALTGINLGGNATAGITQNNYPEIVGILNDSIQKLYTEFPSNKHEEVFIELQDEINLYHLDRKYAQTNTESTEPVKYIADTAEHPFNHRLLNIVSVFNEQAKELPINEPENSDSVFLTDFDTIQVMNPVTGNTLAVIFQAGPQTLLSNGNTYLEQEIDIPAFATYLTKLDVIAHVLQNRKTQNSENEANKYAALYEKELLRLKNQGYRMIEQTQTDKLESRGWV